MDKDLDSWYSCRFPNTQKSTSVDREDGSHTKYRLDFITHHRIVPLSAQFEAHTLATLWPFIINFTTGHALFKVLLTAPTKYVVEWMDSRKLLLSCSYSLSATTCPDSISKNKTFFVRLDSFNLLCKGDTKARYPLIACLAGCQRQKYEISSVPLCLPFPHKPTI